MEQLALKNMGNRFLLLIVIIIVIYKLKYNYKFINKYLYDFYFLLFSDIMDMLNKLKSTLSTSVTNTIQGQQRTISKIICFCIYSILNNFDFLCSLHPLLSNSEEKNSL